MHESKGNMYSWVKYTWNTVKGECPHGCTYCHPADTLVMMSDYTQKKIQDVNTGDKIIGLQKANGKGYYKFCMSTVLNTSIRQEKTIKIITSDSEIECTKEHPLMGSTEVRNCSDWKAARSFSPFEHIRYVSNHSRGNYSTEHLTGYAKGVIDGDGCIFKYYNKEKKEYLGFEMVCIDADLRQRVKDVFLTLFGTTLRDSIKRANEDSYGSDCIMLTTRASKDVEFIRGRTTFRLNKEFAKGYIAGMIDTDGSVGKNGTIRISQSSTVNTVKYQQIKDCCIHLGLNFVEEDNNIRINTNFIIGVDILFDYGIYHSAKSQRLLIGSSVKGTVHSEIQSISTGKECSVYNLQTECENFIANGFIVHNCYMKRFGKQKAVGFDELELKTSLYTDDFTRRQNNFIFVGSSCDMFAEDIPADWILKTLQHCNKHFFNDYLFQTKNPKRLFNYLGNIPLRSSICTTIETNRFYPEIMANSPRPCERAGWMKKITQFKKLVTIEPIMDFDFDDMVSFIISCEPTQVNIGADSGNNHLPEPSKEKLLALIDELKKFTVIDQKRNLNRLLK